MSPTQELVAKVAEVVNGDLSGRRLTELLRGSLLAKGSFQAATREVKSLFCQLGHELGYGVCASGCPDADDGEWLYDLCWYERSQGIYSRQPLVLETELKPGGSILKSADVDGDFEKLVQARADVRVWFCAIPNVEIAKAHVDNCKRQINEFCGTLPGDYYILILYDWTSGSTTIETYQALTSS